MANKGLLVLVRLRNVGLISAELLRVFNMFIHEVRHDKVTKIESPTLTDQRTLFRGTSMPHEVIWKCYL